MCTVISHMYTKSIVALVSPYPTQMYQIKTKLLQTKRCKKHTNGKKQATKSICEHHTNRWILTDEQPNKSPKNQNKKRTKPVRGHNMHTFPCHEMQSQLPAFAYITNTPCDLHWFGRVAERPNDIRACFHHPTQTTSKSNAWHMMLCTHTTGLCICPRTGFALTAYLLPSTNSKAGSCQPKEVPNSILPTRTQSWAINFYVNLEASKPIRVEALSMTFKQWWRPSKNG